MSDKAAHTSLLDEAEPDLTDPENPEWTEEDFARAKGPEHLPPAILANFPKTLASLKAQRITLTLQLDGDVVAAFKGQGEDWEARMNKALRSAIER